MSGVTVRLEQAGDDLTYVERLLSASDLPTTDVRAKPECFFVGFVGDDRVGIGGIERYGADGLLRSVVVDAAVRGSGLGTALCAALEAAAAERGVRTLYLLTTTAAGFFATLGYAEIERAAAPPSIRETAEFTDLCPASATCMRKDL